MRAYLPFLIVLGVSCTSEGFEGFDELSAQSSDSDESEFEGLAFARPVGCIETGNIVKDYFSEAFMQIRIAATKEQKFWVEVCIDGWVTIKVPAFKKFDLRDNCADEEVEIDDQGKFSLSYRERGNTITLIAVLAEAGDAVEVKSLGVIGSYQLVKSADLYRCSDDVCVYDPYSCEGLYIPPPPDTDIDTDESSCTFNVSTMTLECE